MKLTLRAILRKIKPPKYVSSNLLYICQMLVHDNNLGNHDVGSA